MKMPSRDRDVVLISGIVATIRVVVRSGKDDERFYGIAEENKRRLAEQIIVQIDQTLGHEYSLIGFDIQQGSVEFWIMIGTRTAQLLNGFSRYDALLKSIEKLTEQIKTIVRRLFLDDIPNHVTSTLLGAQIEPDTEATWTPGETVIAATQRYSEQRTAVPDLNRILLYYLIASHAGLLAVVIWLVVRLVH
jgi:hypothetical protein